MKLRSPMRCAYCGVLQEILTRDHVLPKSKGGVKTVLACRDCNLDKADTLLQHVNFPNEQAIRKALFLMPLDTTDQDAAARIRALGFGAGWLMVKELRRRNGSHGANRPGKQAFMPKARRGQTPHSRSIAKKNREFTMEEYE